MNKAVIVLSAGMLAAAASLSASAKTPEWFVLKHPEVKTMERMQAQESAGGSVHQQQLAMHVAAAPASASAQTPEWFVLKHPEVKIMERMQAQEASRENADRQQVALHNADLHHPLNRDTGIESHNG